MTDGQEAKDSTSTDGTTAGDDIIFRIGICMSGAISAGAYTAGVFDFLIEALDEWEKARAAPGYDGPPGRAVLATLVGASAGAIAAGIGTVALADTPAPMFAANGSPLGRLRQLYDAWVVKPDLVSADGSRDLLSLADIRPKEPPVSALDAGVLDEISRAALIVAKPGAARPFVSGTLHVYMTLTDLRGTPYSIDFTASDGYHMLSHASRAHFCVGGLGTWRETSPFAADDPGEALQAEDLADPTSKSWDGLRKAALASGAYPFGLAPVEVTARYGAVKFPAAGPQYGAPEPVETAFDKAVFPNGRAFETKAVDGGTIDNDPFEYARFTLMRKPPEPNDRDGGATRAVVMIAPFPEAPPLIAEGEPPSALGSIAKSLLSTLRQQVRFKPDQLLAVRDEGVFSRFMVAPSRVPPLKQGETAEHPEKFTIASGLLGGFGGFVARPFRDHDYQLGRRNCQQFLRTGFLLPVNRAYFRGWSAAAQAAAKAPVQRPERDAHGTPKGTHTDMLPIVPLYGTAAVDVPYPVWPRLPQEDLDTLVERIGARLDAVAKATIANTGLTNRMDWLWRAGLALGEGRLTEYIRWAITADLVERDQIADFDIPDAVVAGLAVPADLIASLKLGATPDPERGLVRAVLSRLASPDYAYRSARGIAQGLADAQHQGAALPAVAEVLKRLAAQPQDRGAAAWRVPWIEDDEVYTLARRKPTGIAAWLKGREPGALFSSPAVDRPDP